MFNPCTKQAVLEAAKRIPTKGNVIDFGNQTYDAGSDFTNVVDFYKSLGFVDYTSLDVNGHGTVICDLNYEVEGLPVSLVVNNGTSEHIFNQVAIFYNAHNLCETHGLMLHVLPFTRWLNHGFYNYNPILFRDLAAANDYQIEFFWLCDRTGKRFKGPDHSEWLFIEKRPDELERLSAESGLDLFNVVCFRKTKDSEFQFPIQGKYLKDAQRVSESSQSGNVPVPSHSGPRLSPSELLRPIGKRTP